MFLNAISGALPVSTPSFLGLYTEFSSVLDPFVSVIMVECQRFFVPRFFAFASARSRCNFSNLAGAK